MLRLKKWHRLQSVDLDPRNIRTDLSPSYFALAQKKKWARTHRTRPPRFEQAENYTESKQHKQGAGMARIWRDFDASSLVWRAGVGLLAAQPPSFVFTISLTVRPSALRPASRACAAFITAPISRIEVAPVSSMASSIACSISPLAAACGR